MSIVHFPFSILYLPLYIALAFLTACSSSSDAKKGGAVLPASKGLPYELTLLVPKPLYSGELRDTLDAILRQSTPGLPQHEPMFRLNVVYPDGHLADGGFSGRHLTSWRTMRLRLLVDTAATTQLGVAHDVIASPQTEVRATAPTPHMLAVMLGRERQRIIDIFVDAELEREADALRRKFSKRTADALRNLTAASGRSRSVCVPVGLQSAKVGIDFLWTGTNLADRDQNFLYYTYPWDGFDLTAATFTDHRDSVLKANIPGAMPGQWMQTARLDGMPLTLARMRIINNVSQLEVRGLWELRAGALGGPFVALAQIDSAARRVVVVEGFVYSPHSPKRPLIRQLEAALHTFY